VSYLIHDCETTIHESYKRKANPFDARNHVVANGFKRPNENIFTHYYGRDRDKQILPILPQDKILVGFNYKFDMLWHWLRPELQDFFRRGGKIWCCQYAEYLLQGQIPSAQMCSMDDIIVKYGGKLKIDEVKAMWKAGIDTVDIPEDLLLRYLGGSDGDISNTEKIFLGQIALARKQGQLVDIMERMEGLLATTEMEFNGLYIDRAVAEQDKAMLERELAAVSDKLDAAIPALPDGCTFSWSSPIHKSALLFGGTIKYEKWTPYLDEAGNQIYAQKKVDCLLKGGEHFVPCDTATPADWLLADKYAKGKRSGEYKTKQVTVPDETKPKGRKCDYLFELKGYTNPEPEWKSKLTDGADNPVFKTGKEIIEVLGKRDIDFLKSLANREKIAKDLSTYYLVEDDHGKQSGMLTCVGSDSIIHHKLNHTITVTTRLSSSDPNLQNLTRSDYDEDLGRAKSLVKRMFSSRFGPDGCMLEIDYSQLEVVVQGLLSGDKQLIADLIARVDFHCKRLSAKLHEEYEVVKLKCKDESHPEHEVYKLQRIGCKKVSFQMAYGAGATKMAASTGLPKEEVEAIVAADNILYPGIKDYYDHVQQVCESNRYPTNIREPLPDKPGVEVQLGRGFYTTPTQARFVFTEVPQEAYLRKRTNRDAGFYRPYFQNYPIQGVGGQLVQYVLGRIFRFFVKHNNFNGQAFMVNTVHDCVWFDCKTTALGLALAPHIVKIMESIPEILKELFGIDCPVPFPVAAEYGNNMLELKGVPTC